MVLVANDREAVPFVTLISTAPDHAILARLDIPRATNGLHQPVWDRNNELFYLPVTEVDRIKANGEIAAIDRGGRLVASYPVDECQPAGLTVGPDGDLCIGCSSSAVALGFRARSLIMELKTGTVVATIMDVGGSDEVWYNSGDERYYLAASAMPDGPVLGVIDAKTRSCAAVSRSTNGGKRHHRPALPTPGAAICTHDPTADPTRFTGSTQRPRAR